MSKKLWPDLGHNLVHYQIKDHSVNRLNSQQAKFLDFKSPQAIVSNIGQSVHDDNDQVGEDMHDDSFLVRILSHNQSVSLTRRQIARIKTTQKATSHSYSILKVMYWHIHITAGMATSTKHTMTLKVLR
jgi:hypothetical protein